jgi:serine/threonine protein kinase/WD40 repeat protein
MNQSSHESAQNKEESLFQEALRLNAYADRILFLNEACGDDTALYDRLVALINAHTEDENFIQTVDRAEDPTELLAPSTEATDSTIGRYRLLQQIGEGGMGVVYMAEQQEPVRRKVALKIIKVGMDTKHVVARFEAERQALAMMDHPNIARVHDGGATENGRPYFVMELVQGVPITEFCDKNKLPLSERLELFMPVCQAIHSAHRKGIIHRDIKPSNVLVTLHHGQPMPKVIDFGIAKATNQKLTEKTLYTQFAQMIGTPAYMSPEQAEMSSMDVDTRTDIYSLGVLLFELLTGTTPLPAGRLKELAYGELQRVIAQEELPKPSTRLGTMEADTKTSIAKQRSIDAKSLAQQFQGDLDWIVMKCLEKDRRRRYETPKELVTDIQAHLNHEPVSAAAPSLTYQAQKFLHRYQSLVTAIASVLIVFLIGTAVAGWLAFRATQAQHRAEAAEKKTNEALEKESQLRSLAEEAQREAESMRHDANRELYYSLLAQARLTRMNRQAGLRVETDSLLRQANALDTDVIDKLELRNEAIASILTPFSAATVPIQGFPPFEIPRNLIFNQPFDEVPHLSRSGELSLYSIDPKQASSTVFTLKTEPIVDFGFSPSGSELVTGHRNGAIRVWQRHSSTHWTMRREIFWPTQDSPIKLHSGDLAIKADGFVVVERNRQRALEWKTFLAEEPITHPLSGAFDRQGSRLIPSVSADGTLLVIPTSAPHGVSIWNLRKHQLVKRVTTMNSLTKHPGSIRTQFSPDGRFIAVATELKLIVIDTQGLNIHFSRQFGGNVLNADFSPDSKRLVFGVEECRILDLDTLEQNLSLHHQPGWFAFSGMNDGLYQFAPHLNVVNFLPEGDQSIATLAGHRNMVREIVFDPQTRMALTSSFDGSVRQWKQNGATWATKLVEEGEFTPGDISFSPDRKFVATTQRNATGTVSIRDVGTLEVVQQFELGAPAVGIGFSPRGDRLAVGGVDTLKVWSCEKLPSHDEDYPYTRQLTFEISEEGLGWVSDVRFSPDGSKIAFIFGSVSEQSQSYPIHIVDLATSSVIRTPIETRMEWRTYDFISDTQLVIAGKTRDLEIWNIDNHELERTIVIPGMEQQIIKIGVATNPRFIALQGGPKIGAYDLQLDKTLFCAPILPHNNVIGAIRWNDHTGLIGLAGNDKRIRILDLPLVRKQLSKLDLDWND